ncbi:hypothetical protein [Anaerovorax sp. IOR16]|uniref:hypothetical protein n=1 Tax=Anaerovorax sp. IOR16 TaxID=2773458 RepID=UPI0019D16125|nr:hypothetical protein [Anaerovorax sp. IOR16]
MPDVQDFTLQKIAKDDTFISVRKSYELDSLKALATVLLSKKSLSLQIVDSSGAVLWQGKSNPKTEVAQCIDE